MRKERWDAAVIAILAVLSVCAFVLDALLMYVMTDRMHGNDFGKFYYSARAFLEGGDMYAPNIATALPVAGAREVQLLNMNPPHFHLLILPFAVLQPGRAVIAWMVVSLVALIASVLLIVRELELTWTPKGAVLAVAGILAFGGTQAFFVSGQLSMLLLLALTLCWIHARRGRWSRAALWLGACLSIKPFLLIFVPYLLAARRFRSLIVAGATAAAAFAIGLAVFGAAAYRSWWHAVAQSGDWAWTSLNVSALGLFRRCFDVAPGLAPVWVNPQLVSLWPIVAVIVGVITVLTVLADKRDTDRAFALSLVGAQLVSPLGWIYYLSAAAGPVAAIVSRGGTLRRAPSGRWRGLTTHVLACAAIVGLVWPNPWLGSFQPHRWATMFIASIYFWATLAGWTWLVIERKPPSSKVAHELAPEL